MEWTPFDRRTESNRSIHPIRQHKYYCFKCKTTWCFHFPIADRNLRCVWETNYQKLRKEELRTQTLSLREQENAFQVCTCTDKHLFWWPWSRLSNQSKRLFDVCCLAENHLKLLAAFNGGGGGVNLHRMDRIHWIFSMNPLENLKLSFIR